MREIHMKGVRAAGFACDECNLGMIQDIEGRPEKVKCNHCSRVWKKGEPKPRKKPQQDRILPDPEIMHREVESRMGRPCTSYSISSVEVKGQQVCTYIFSCEYEELGTQWRWQIFIDNVIGSGGIID